MADGGRGLRLSGAFWVLACVASFGNVTSCGGQSSTDGANGGRAGAQGGVSMGGVTGGSDSSGGSGGATAGSGGTTPGSGGSSTGGSGATGGVGTGGGPCIIPERDSCPAPGTACMDGDTCEACGMYCDGDPPCAQGGGHSRGVNCACDSRTGIWACCAYGTVSGPPYCDPFAQGGVAGVGGVDPGDAGEPGTGGLGGRCTSLDSCPFPPTYVDVDGPTPTPNRLPAACDAPPEEQPPWLCGNSVCASLRESFNDATLCVDEDRGLSSTGVVTFPRGPGDLVVLSNVAAPQGPAFACHAGGSIDQASLVQCHRGPRVAVQNECGVPPEGTGGMFAPGAYVLTEFVGYDTLDVPPPGSAIWQTLYLTGSSALLISSDWSNFEFTGTYNYQIDGNVITFEAACESTSPSYRAFPRTSTYTATVSSLELFDFARRVRAKYERL